MNLREGLGFRRLSPPEQQAYRIMLQAFSSMATSFDSSQIGRYVDLMKVVQVLLGDNPSIVYFNKTQIRTVGSMFGKQIQLTGVPLKVQITKLNADLEAKAKTIVAPIASIKSNEYSQLIKLYEYMQNNIKYDRQELLDSSKGRSKNLNSHNAYGALINGLAVCDGFSSAFSLLAQMLGFECTLAMGHSTHSSAGSVEHAWNIVKVGNKCYHMDVTWDANQYGEFGEYSFDYFALDDEEIANDHDWDINTTPACSSNDFSYFLKSGQYANNAGQLNDIIRNSTKNRNEPVRIKLSHNVSLPANAGEHLAQTLVDEAVKAGNSAQISYQWNESTRCFFAKFTV